MEETGTAQDEGICGMTLLRQGFAVHPDDSIRDTRPILEDSIREDLKKMSDEELRLAWDWSNSWTRNHVSAVRRWVARGPIQDEFDRRRASLISPQRPLPGPRDPIDGVSEGLPAPLSLPEP